MKKALALLPLLVALTACQSAPQGPAEAPPAAPPAIFVYAPTVGRSFQHTMTRFEEVAVVGAPLRNSEEWEIVWDITIEQETNLYLYRAKLSSLKISTNGAEILKGPEVKPYGAMLELLLDANGTVVDVRKTQSITAALMELLPGPSREAIAQMFSPDMLRVLFLVRANERSQDLLGNPSKVGASWGGRSGPDGDGPVTKAVTVEEQLPCGEGTCVRVSRTLGIDQETVWQSARARVEAYVKENGGDPSAVKLTSAEMQIDDEFIVDPTTLQFFGATFNHKSTLSVDSPKGALTVAFTSRRGSTYKY